MPNIISWINSFETSAHPFKDGGVSFPQGLLVDAQFVVPSRMTNPITLFYTQNSGTRLTLTFASGVTIIGSASVVAGAINNASVPVMSPDGVQAGVLVFGANASDARQKISLGTKTYTTQRPEIEPSCVFRFPSNVLTSVVTAAGIARGKIALIEGVGVRIVKESDSGIRIDAVGDPEAIRNCCGVSGVPLRRLNDAAPTESGEISINIESFSEPLTAEDLRQVIRIETLPGKLVFSMNS